MLLLRQLNVLVDLFSYFLTKIFLSLTSFLFQLGMWQLIHLKNSRFRLYCWFFSLILFPGLGKQSLYYETISTDHRQLKSYSLVHSSLVPAKFCHVKCKQGSRGCSSSSNDEVCSRLIFTGAWTFEVQQLHTHYHPWLNVTNAINI